MTELLKYEHVDISYNGKTAVRDIHFTLHQGEILGIAGESGSGKSTLIKAAMGLLGPSGMVTRGNIFYRDKNLVDISNKERKKINGEEIGMIFQNAGASFSPIRTISDQLYESLLAHNYISKTDYNEQAENLLRKLHFDDPQRILKSYPFELSGGMQQRAGIAAAMLLKPEILLADEPTSALDVSIQKQVVEEMLSIRREFNTAIIIVTHNIGVIRKMADTVMIMKDGEMAEYGRADQILNYPKHPYTQKLLAAVPVLRR